MWRIKVYSTDLNNSTVENCLQQTRKRFTSFQKESGTDRVSYYMFLWSLIEGKFWRKHLSSETDLLKKIPVLSTSNKSKLKRDNNDKVRLFIENLDSLKTWHIFLNLLFWGFIHNFALLFHATRLYDHTNATDVYIVISFNKMTMSQWINVVSFDLAAFFFWKGIIAMIWILRSFIYCIFTLPHLDPKLRKERKFSLFLSSVAFVWILF